jgi:hypothetical protein
MKKYINNSCLQENIFRNNTANYGGAALRINGFSVEAITDNRV